MIIELSTYQLRNMGKSPLSTDVENLFPILYYKSWRLLSDKSGNLPIEFQVNNKFRLGDETGTYQGGWKLIKQKHLILTFHNEIFYCHTVYYDGELLILKVYGERRFVVLISSSTQLSKPSIPASDIEAYLEGNKEQLKASRSQTDKAKISFLDILNKVLLLLVGIMTVVGTYIFGFPFYGSVLFSSFLTICCYGLLKKFKNQKNTITIIFSLIILFMLYLAH